jgi:SAM-dependent methyltransferase
MQPEYSEKYFKTRFREDAIRLRSWKYLTRYLQRYVSEGDTILELGAGYGYFINEIKAHSKFAVDLFQELGEYCQPDVKYHIGNVTDLSVFETSTVDIFFASNLLEHLDRKDLDKLLLEVCRVGKPNCKFIVIQPNYRYCSKRYFDDYTHLTIFSDISMRDWMSSKGFDCIKSQPRFLPLTLKSRGRFLVGLLPLYLRSPIKPMAGQMFLMFSRSEDVAKNIPQSSIDK